MVDVTEGRGDGVATATVEIAAARDAPASTVRHEIPGRLRLHVPRVAVDAAYATRLSTLVAADPRVSAVRISPLARSVTVRYDPTLPGEPMRARLDAALRAASDATRGAAVRDGLVPSSPSAWRRAARPAPAVILALLSGAFRVALPAPVIAGALAVAALPIARRALRSVVVHRRLDIDVLDITAIVLTTIRGSFLAPTVMISLVEIGEAIRDRTRRGSEREVLDLIDSMAQFVWVDRGAEPESVPVGEVRRGESVVVYPGDRIPVDGRVVQGRALVDEHQLTGEPMPVMREEGQTVYASTLVREGHVHIRVELTGRETRAGRIIQLMQDAPVHDTRIENYAARLADRAVLPSFVLSAAVLALTRDPGRAASVLITDFMTGVRVSVPTTVLAALTGAAREGILIRSGRALEQLATVDTVVFDKTGTVTGGQPTIVGIEALGALSPREILTVAATAEQRLTHPVAEAVMRYAEEQQVVPGRRRDWRYDIGLGVRADVEGRTVLVGSHRLLDQHEVAVDPATADGVPRMYVAVDGQLVGAMTYADPLRPESREVIAALRRSTGADIHLLTGDNRRTAAAVARTLGIDADKTHAELFPEEKAAVVRALRAEGRRVAFVGDGVNDLPALAYADVGVSFSGATDVARETADVVLMAGDLSGLPRAIAIAREALGLVRQNIVIIGGSNLAALTAAVTGTIGPTAAAVVHNTSTIVAGANGLRPLARRAGPRASPGRPCTPD